MLERSVGVVDSLYFSEPGTIINGIPSLHSSCHQLPFIFIGHLMLSCIYNFAECGSDINTTLFTAPCGLVEQILFH